jgi:hypothetical protein
VTTTKRSLAIRPADPFVRPGRPHGHFQSLDDGHPVRLPDGIHISTDGSEFVQPSIMPVIVQLGLEWRARKASP